MKGTLRALWNNKFGSSQVSHGLSCDDMEFQEANMDPLMVG